MNKMLLNILDMLGAAALGGAALEPLTWLLTNFLLKFLTSSEEEHDPGHPERGNLPRPGSERTHGV